MKKLLRYLPLLTLALIASCTTIDEGMDKTEVLQVSTNKMEIEALSSKETFTITSYCDWLAVITYEDNDSKWINLSSTNGSLGTKDVTVTFDENKTLDDRYATITVINSRYGLSQAIKIHQKAFEPYILLDKSEEEVIADGEVIELVVNSNIDYTIISSESWAKASVNSGSKGEKKLSITVDETPALEVRSATITFSGKEHKATTTFSIKQQKLEPVIELDTETITSIALGTTKSITLESNISWKASCDADWITITPASGKKGTSTLKVVVAENTKTVARESVVKVFNAEYNIEKQIAVTQDLNENANRMIVYTSSNNNIILPSVLGDDRTVFGAEIIENRYNNGIGVILFDGEVTTIGEWAFYCCDNLTSITIPDNVTTIGELAFSDCSSLTSVTIPDSVTEIGECAFGGCSSLTSITIPDSVTTIGDCAFLDCSSLTSVTIGDSVTTIGEMAFSDCSSLTSVYCRAVTPPITVIYDVYWYAFYNNAPDRKIYVPMESVEAYKSAEGWENYADAIVGYNF